MCRLKPRVVLCLALSALAFAPPAARMGAAQALGTAFTYQGQLIDAGSPANGTYDFQFVLYDAAVGGSQVGPTVTSDDVVVANGLFTVSLDFGAVFAGDKRFLDIGVRPGASSGAYTPLASRQELTPSPNAVFSSATPWAGVSGKPPGFADDVDNDILGGLSCVSGQVAKWNGSAWACAADADSGGDITAVTAGTGLTGGGTTGPVTLNVSFAGSGAAATASRSDHDHFGQVWAPAAAPAVDGLTINTNNTSPGHAAVTGIHSATSTLGYGLWARTLSTAGVAVHGEALAGSGGTIGVEGVSNSTFGAGVYGNAPAASGPTAGVYGQSLSTGGYGVWGRAAASTGPATGVFGETFSSDGTAVRGFALAPAGNGTGVSGASDSAGGSGVVGSATHTSGPTIGVEGTTRSSNGLGVVGSATATTGTTSGVLGENVSSTGYGVYGTVIATAGSNYGVYGVTASTAAGYAGYFSGRVAVTGTLSKGGGSFKIDHPLDPENKYLYHSFVESPDMMNVYNGNVTSDDDGYATVELPDWFGALNRDFRYQLTVLDEADSPVFVQVKLVKKIAENRFTLRTSLPRTEVSWQVTGIRKDAFADAHRIPVEEEKPAEERGTYLYPVEHGMPKEKGRDYKLMPTPPGPHPPESPAAETLPPS